MVQSHRERAFFLSPRDSRMSQLGTDERFPISRSATKTFIYTAGTTIEASEAIPKQAFPVLSLVRLTGTGSSLTFHVSNDGENYAILDAENSSNPISSSNACVAPLDICAFAFVKIVVTTGTASTYSCRLSN